MKIYIHTYGRENKQITYNNIPDSVIERFNISLLVQNRESKKYLKYDNVIVLPKGIARLSPTRQWIVDNSDDRFTGMMDDDLFFFERILNTKLSKITEKGFIDMFSTMDRWLKEGVAHCGISAREGNNRVLKNQEDCTRMVRALFYNLDIVNSEGCRFDRVVTKQDFDMTLQLLRKGYLNRVSFKYAHNQSGGSNSKGGCSSYRTENTMVQSANRLAKLHPDFVKVVEKETKTSWGGGTRTDVRIAWKKSYNSNGV